ncbi:MAG: polyphosphate polymerase domain-containing protein [Myxococcota bacterium]|nr:polyphosphate polymerase domain-containing protein [Myxococcota bacterium]
MPAARGLTGVRQEVKYLLPASRGAALLAQLPQYIPAKLYDGQAHSFRASSYLDTDDMELCRTALVRGSQCVKLRVKEYYHNDEGRPTSDGMCHFEVKARCGAMVEKSRFKVKRLEVCAILAGKPKSGGDAAQRAEIHAFEEVRQGRALHPVLVAHYRRHTFQSKDSRTRITLDDQVTFHVPPQDLFTPAFALTAREVLAPPLCVEASWILEIKCLGLVPEWTSELLEGVAEVDFSKFSFGVQSLARCGLLPGAVPS